MQVDGFNLDAQKETLRRYTEFQQMYVAGEYSDEGKSEKIKLIMFLYVSYILSQSKLKEYMELTEAVSDEK